MSKEINGFIAWITSFLDDIYAQKGSGGSITLNDVYPVGSIYMSVNNASPQSLFGGTWVQLEDTFLYATSTTADTGTTAPSGQGEATHTLTKNEMPSHNHTQNQHRHQQGHRSVYDGSGKAVASIGYNAGTSGNVTYYTSYETPTINNEGGGQAHNNMPPYMKVYMWKRTG